MNTSEPLPFSILADPEAEPNDPCRNIYENETAGGGSLNG
jgi:hypothetical protein